MKRPGMRGRLWIAVALVLVLLGGVAWYRLLREEPLPYVSDADYFKYGSVGVEANSGLPFAVWRVLPTVFGDLIDQGGGYSAFGFIQEPGRPMPIGLPVQTVGFPRVGLNCGLCHIGSVREQATAPQRIVLGAPNSTLDLQRYFRFLFAAASDDRFRADVLIPAIEIQQPLSFLDRLELRLLVIPQFRSGLLEQKRQLWWMDTVPDWGPGRVDPFNPAKVQLVHLPPDGTIGAARMLPLWNWNARKNFGLHRDGLNTSLTEIFLNSGIGNGASNRSIDRVGLERLQKWVGELKPPAYPFAIDKALADRGAPIYRQYCADCHAFGGAKTGQPLPIDEVGTDRHRFDSWTTQARDGFNGLDDYDWHYTHFRKTSGYMSQALDGLWARAPYLHNGSVPNLADLLNAPDQRPATFVVGYDVYDQRRVGFVSDGEEARVQGRVFDTRLPGNGNGGHVYGTTLPDADKQALLEYLKTL